MEESVHDEAPLSKVLHFYSRQDCWKATTSKADQQINDGHGA
jgi:hypothetical protein